LGDSMGELLVYYSLAQFAFVGGSLVTTGCHNILEPAALGLPVITGPSQYNFQTIKSSHPWAMPAKRLLPRIAAPLSAYSPWSTACCRPELLRISCPASMVAASGCAPRVVRPRYCLLF
jgi:hypothetical protein